MTIFNSVYLRQCGVEFKFQSPVCLSPVKLCECLFNYYPCIVHDLCNYFSSGLMINIFICLGE